MEIISKNYQDTFSLAESLKHEVSNDVVFLLYGNLGAGKTTFVKGMVNALGGDQKDVSSPTYVYTEEYDFLNFKVYHFDLYRIQKGGFDIELADFFEDSLGPIFIEWPENISEALLIQIRKVYKVIEIHFEIISPNTRKITVLKCQN